MMAVRPTARAAPAAQQGRRAARRRQQLARGDWWTQKGEVAATHALFGIVPPYTAHTAEVRIMRPDMASPMAWRCGSEGRQQSLSSFSLFVKGCRKVLNAHVADVRITIGIAHWKSDC